MHCFMVQFFKPRVRFQDHLDHGRSNLVQSGFISSFDLPWSEWSRITDPDPDIPKERTPKKVLIVAHLNEIHHEWNYHVLHFQYFKEIWDLSWISNCKRFLDCVHLFQLRVVKWMIMPLQRYVHFIYYFCFFQFSISN